MKPLLLFLLLLFCLPALSQDNQNIEALKQRIDSLQHRLDDANYVHVPRKDYDDQLSYTVSNAVSNSIWKWIGGLATVMGLVGIFISNFFKGQIEENVKRQIDEKLKSVSDKFKALEEKNDIENLRQDNRLRDLTERIDKLLQLQTTFVSETTTSIEKKLEDSLGFMWDDIAESKYNRIKEQQFKGQKLIDETIYFLEQKNIKLKPEKSIILVDGLMRCYYNTPEVKDKYKKMIALLRQYETQFELMPETYASAAIALINNYEMYGLKVDRDACLDSCEKSINRLPDYGTSYAVKLEAYMIDYKKAFSDVERAEAIENTERTFSSIENNQSTYLSKELVQRLYLDKEVKYLKQYIQALDILFNDRMVSLKERVCKETLLFVSVNKMSEDVHGQTLLQIVNEHLLRVLNFNGKWLSKKVIANGVELANAVDANVLVLTDANYTLQLGDGVEKGIVHFLPFTNSNGLNLYSENANGQNQLYSMLYKVEQDELIVCFAAADTTVRPTDFTSTPQNNHTLIYFAKEVLAS